MKNKATNATAKRDLKDVWGHAVKAGEQIFMRRERARSYKHARDAGTMYPWSYYCATCAEKIQASLEEKKTS